MLTYQKLIGNIVFKKTNFFVLKKILKLIKRIDYNIHLLTVYIEKYCEVES